MTKIASIVWYKILPARFGGQKGIALFNKHLAQHIPLVCLCSRNNEKPAAPSFEIIPGLPTGKSQFLLPSCWSLIRKTVVDEKATHIILEHPYHGIAGVKAARASGAKLVIHSHNIESQRFRLAGKWWWKFLNWYERWAHRKADLNFFKTESDRDWALDHFGLAAEKCFVVPYGVEPATTINQTQARELMQRIHGIHPGEKILLFAGTLDYAPNAQAVKDIFERIAPALTGDKNNYRIIICGRNQFKQYSHLSALSHPSVIMVGEVDDINPYFDAADVFINPVRTGGGVQTKNIDALAHHCNVVCFDTMIDPTLKKLAPGKIFSVPDGEWEQFIQKVRIAENGKGNTPAEFFRQFDWQQIATRVAGIIRAN